MQEATLPRAKILPCLSVRFEYSNGTSDQALKVYAYPTHSGSESMGKSGGVDKERWRGAGGSHRKGRG